MMKLPNLDLRKLDVEFFEDDDFINDDQKLDEAIENELCANPSNAMSYQNLDQFKH